MALTAGRNTVETNSKTLNLPVKGGVKIYEGSLVALEEGLAIPGEKAEGLIAAGRAEEYIDNTDGADGDVTIKVTRGVFKFENDVTNPVTTAELLSNCYILDDETVTALATGASVAGKVIALDDSEVIVEIK